MRRRPSVSEGFLIALLGIIGMLRVLDSLPDAGAMSVRMLYTELFIFAAIIVIGMGIVRDALRRGE